MAKTAVIRARTEPELKTGAERIFKRLGMSSAEAINLFYTQVMLHKGLPFEVKIPNAETAETLRKSRQGKELKAFDTVDALLKDLGI